MLKTLKEEAREALMFEPRFEGPSDLSTTWEDNCFSSFRVAIDDDKTFLKSLAEPRLDCGTMIIFQAPRRNKNLVGSGTYFEYEGRDRVSALFQKSLFKNLEREAPQIALPLTNNLLDSVIFSISLTDDVDELQRDGRIDEALDLLFARVDERLLERNFRVVDFFLRMINANSFTDDILIGILTITLSWKANLLNRKLFYKKVEDRLSITKKSAEVSRVLLGLD